MTCIGALVYDDAVYLAADTVASTDRRWYDTHKIIRKEVGKTDFALLAFAGRAAIRNAVDNELVISRAPHGKVERRYDEWAHDVACAITELLLEAKPPLTTGNGEGFAGTGLLAYAGRLWSIETNAADRCGVFEAIGTGEEYALGALYALDASGLLHVDPERSLRIAVEAACRWDAGCGGPIDVEVSK